MSDVRTAVNLGRGLRKRNEIRTRQPLLEVTIITRDPTVREEIAGHTELIAEELNVKHVSVEDNEDHLVHLSAKANFKVLGPRLGAKMRDVARGIEELDHGTVSALLDGASAEVAGETIVADDIVVARAPREGVVVAAEGPLSVALDCTITSELQAEGLAREVVNRVQAARREAGFDVTDRIDLTWETADETLAAAIVSHTDLITDEVLAVTIRRAAGGLEVDVTGMRLEIGVAAV